MPRAPPAPIACGKRAWRSFGRVGRFIGKDHATVLYGAARYAVKHGLPIPRGAKPNNYLRWHGPRLDVIA